MATILRWWWQPYCDGDGNHTLSFTFFTAVFNTLQSGFTPSSCKFVTHRSGCHSGLIHWKSQYVTLDRYIVAKATCTYTQTPWRWHFTMTISLGKLSCNWGRPTMSVHIPFRISCENRKACNMIAINRSAPGNLPPSQVRRVWLQSIAQWEFTTKPGKKSWSRHSQFSTFFPFSKIHSIENNSVPFAIWRFMRSACCYMPLDLSDLKSMYCVQDLSWTCSIMACRCVRLAWLAPVRDDE